MYRKNLSCVLLLIDVSLTPQKLDIAWINWLGDRQIPFILLFTKADKVPLHQVQGHIAAFNQVLCAGWEVLPTALVTSARNAWGLQDVLTYLSSFLGKV